MLNFYWYSHASRAPFIFFFVWFDYCIISRSSCVFLPFLLLLFFFFWKYKHIFCVSLFNSCITYGVFVGKVALVFATYYFTNIFKCTSFCFQSLWHWLEAILVQYGILNQCTKEKINCLLSFCFSDMLSWEFSCIILMIDLRFTSDKACTLDSACFRFYWR